MSIKAVLFDLDGTLLPMDQDKFVELYFGLLAKKMAPFGYNPEQYIKAIWAGTKEMIKNNGQATNEQVFFKKYSELFGEDAVKDEETLAEFYEKDFVKTQSVCRLDPETANVIKKLKEMGVKVVVATNPIFPKVAIMHRVKWAGLNPDDFEHITHYGNSRFSKPNPNYYLDIAEKLGVKPENCLMVGNDVSDDMPATKAGMKVFLKTRCLINKLNEDITQYPNGDWDKFWDYFYTI